MRTSRREFLTTTGAALAALPFAAAGSVSPTGIRPPVSDLIDCQSHLFCPEHVALMENRDRDPIVRVRDGQRVVIMGDWVRKLMPRHSDVDAKLADMDAAGIAMTALSINDPGPEWFGADDSAVAQMLNDYIAGIVKKHPARFFGLCVLPLQDAKAAQAELDRCAKLPGMKGILLYTNLFGQFPDEPQFRWLFHRAVDLDWPVLLHPALPVTTPQVKGYEMISTLGNMFDDTIALTRLILSGLLDELPKLKLVCPHLGGTLPYIIGRLDHQTQVLKRGPRNLTRAPSEYLTSVWLDIVSPLPLAIRFCGELFGNDRLLYASDHPWVDPALIRDGLLGLNLSAADEENILRGNARKLFNL